MPLDRDDTRCFCLSNRAARAITSLSSDRYGPSSRDRVALAAGPIDVLCEKLLKTARRRCEAFLERREQRMPGKLSLMRAMIFIWHLYF